MLSTDALTSFHPPLFSLQRSTEKMNPHHTVHFFRGFSRDPVGHLKASEKAGKLERTPMTRKICKQFVFVEHHRVFVGSWLLFLFFGYYPLVIIFSPCYSLVKRFTVDKLRAGFTLTIFWNFFIEKLKNYSYILDLISVFMTFPCQSSVTWSFSHNFRWRGALHLVCRTLLVKRFYVWCICTTLANTSLLCFPANSVLNQQKKCEKKGLVIVTFAWNPAKK